MTIRNLEYLFNPSSIAVVGASKEGSSIGSVLARNLFNAGFDGPVMPVNPHHHAIQGTLAYPDIDSLPETPDLAVVATPPDSVPEIIAALGARGTRAAVVVTAAPWRFAFRRRGGDRSAPIALNSDLCVDGH